MADFMVGFLGQIIEISMQAGVAVLCVLAAGRILYLMRTPKKYTYWLWSIPFLRLLLPAVPTRSFSLYPGEAQVVETLQPLLEQPVQYISGGRTWKQGVSLQQSVADRVLQEQTITDAGNSATEVGGSADFAGLFPYICVTVWLIGVLAILGYSIWSVLRLERQLQVHVPVQEGVYAVDGIPSAFVMGLRKARIYVPAKVDPEKLVYVLAHEREHIRRADYLVKPIVFILCAVYWFQPLVWLGYLLFSRDMELACDEGVIVRQEKSYRKAYASALLDLSVENKVMGPIPLAFSEGSPRKRIRSIVNYRKSGIVAVIVGVIMLGCLVILLLTRPNVESSEQVTAGYIAGNGFTIENLQSGIEAAGEVETNRITVMVPVVDLEASVGADGVQLYYGDSQKLIVGGYFGLFVYSMEEKMIFRALDLAAIECQYTQGDRYCEIMVSVDGNTVYLHPMHLEEMYVYHVQENTLYKEPYDLAGVELYKGVQEQRYVTYVENGRERTISMASDWKDAERGDIGAAGYYIDGSFFHPLFKEELYPDAVYFEPGDLYDLVKIEMQQGGTLYSTDNEEALQYIEKFLGNCKKDIGDAGCPFYDPMYLTRADGVVGIIYPATDSCSIFCCGNGGCYDYTPGYGDNEEFWNLIGNWNMGMGE